MLSLIPCHSSAWSEAQVAPSIHKPDLALHIPGKGKKKTHFVLSPTQNSKKKQKNILLIKVKLGSSQSTAVNLQHLGAGDLQTLTAHPQRLLLHQSKMSIQDLSLAPERQSTPISPPKEKNN